MDRRVLPLALALVLLGVWSAGPGAAGELIRYRRADGKVGFAGSASSVPPGAEILRREPASGSASRAVPDSLDLEEALAGVRRHCESRYAGGGAGFEACLAEHTRAAFAVRDLLAETPPDSVAARLSETCRRRWARGSRPDYAALARCIEDAHADLEQDPVSPPARRDADAAGAGRPRSAPQEERLRSLRDEQARAERELQQGRATWGPRYRKAERELRAAEAKSRGILERMQRRGCRADSLACGGLPELLEAARRDEQSKRDYLTDGIVNECRLAGCQPGWLR